MSLYEKQSTYETKEQRIDGHISDAKSFFASTGKEFDSKKNKPFRPVLFSRLEDFNQYECFDGTVLEMWGQGKSAQVIGQYVKDHLDALAYDEAMCVVEDEREGV